MAGDCKARVRSEIDELADGICHWPMGHQGKHGDFHDEYGCRHSAVAQIYFGQIQRAQEFEQKLKEMREDRDDYRRRALQNIAPAFFVVWCPNGPTPPRYEHETHGEAREEAKRLAALHPDQRFYVLAEAGHAIAESANWHCDQSHWDEGIPF